MELELTVIRMAHCYSDEQVYFITTKTPHPIVETITTLLMLLKQEPTSLVAGEKKKQKRIKDKQGL